MRHVTTGLPDWSLELLRYIIPCWDIALKGGKVFIYWQISFPAWDLLQAQRFLLIKEHDCRAAQNLTACGTAGKSPNTQVSLLLDPQIRVGQWHSKPKGTGHAADAPKCYLITSTLWQSGKCTASSGKRCRGWPHACGELTEAAAAPVHPLPQP